MIGKFIPELTAYHSIQYEFKAIGTSTPKPTAYPSIQDEFKVEEYYSTQTSQRELGSQAQDNSQMESQSF